MVNIGSQTSGSKSFLELGFSTTGNTTFIDFHSQNNGGADYDTRILSSGGSSSTTVGQGDLYIYANTLSLFTSYNSASTRLFGSHYVLVNNSYTLANSSTSQTLLPSGMTTLTTTANTWYRFNGLFYLSKSAGATAHFAAVGFASSTNISNMTNRVLSNDNDSSTTKYLSTISDNYIGGTGNTAITSTSSPMTAINQRIWFSMDGTFSTSTAGTLIPTIAFSAAPGGTYTVNVGSYFNVIPMGSTNGGTGNLSVGFA